MMSERKLKTIRTAAAVLLWAATVVWMAVIFRFSSQTGTESAEVSESLLSKIVEIAGNIIGHNTLRKCAHAFEYFVLSVLTYAAVGHSFGRQRPVLSFTVSFLYAVSDEVHQIFVEGRACRLFDLFVDGAGILVGIVLWKIFLVLMKKIKEKNRAC